MATERGKRKKRSPKGKPDNPEQSRKFIEAARKLGVDEDGKAFQEAMRSLLKAKAKAKAKANGNK